MTLELADVKCLHGSAMDMTLKQATYLPPDGHYLAPSLFVMSNISRLTLYLVLQRPGTGHLQSLRPACNNFPASGLFHRGES